MKRKRCGKCNRARLTKFFKANPSRKDGLNWQCVDCHREYRKAHYEENKQKYIQRAKTYRKQLQEYAWSMKKRCKECGENHPATLDFHHRDRAGKDINIMMVVSRSGTGRLKLEAEIAKCDVLCSNCHRKLHWNERE